MSPLPSSTSEPGSGVTTAGAVWAWSPSRGSTSGSPGRPDRSGSPDAGGNHVPGSGYQPIGGSVGKTGSTKAPVPFWRSRNFDLNHPRCKPLSSSAASCATSAAVSQLGPRRNSKPSPTNTVRSVIGSAFAGNAHDATRSDKPNTVVRTTIVLFVRRCRTTPARPEIWREIRGTRLRGCYAAVSVPLVSDFVLPRWQVSARRVSP